MAIPQRNITILRCGRKASSIWRYSKRYTPSFIFVVPVTESIVNTSRIPITILLPALGEKVYFTQEWCPLPLYTSYYSHRNPHTLVLSMQSGIARHAQNRIMDILCPVCESISMLQEPSVPVVEQLCQLVVQFLLCLHQLVVSHRIVESMHTYCPHMRVSHHQNRPWHLSQQAHTLHPVQKPPSSKLLQYRRTPVILVICRYHMRCPM